MNFEEFRADAVKRISELEAENEALKKLADNNDSENATNLLDFYWRCGNENAINYICNQLKIDFNA